MVNQILKSQHNPTVNPDVVAKIPKKKSKKISHDIPIIFPLYPILLVKTLGCVKIQALWDPRL